MRRRLGTVAVALAVMVLVACSAGTAVTPNPSPEVTVGDGSWYAREQWPHDGHPYESDSFVVYSDAAAEWARVEAAEEAERLWADVLDEFSVTPDQLSFPEGQDKIHLYVYRDRYPESWGMRAYWAGVILWSPDHSIRPTARSEWSPVLKHELVHVLENLLKGRDGGDGEMTDAWFSEGLAEAVSGGTAGGAIRDRHQLDDLTARFGRISPISYTRDSQVTSSCPGYAYYYPMSQLAVEYLLDDDGAGRSLTDARDLFLAMSGDASFGEAFAATMKTTTSVFEVSFFEKMETYLPAYRNPLFSPVGFAALSAAIVAAVVAALVLAFRRSGPSATVPVWRRRTEKTANIVTAVVTTGVCLVLLYIVGTDHELNNEMNTPGRLAGYAILAVAMIVATGFVAGGILLRRRWPVVARLGPALAVASVLGTVLILEAVL